MKKFDGIEERELTVPEIKQIAGALNANLLLWEHLTSYVELSTISISSLKIIKDSIKTQRFG